MAAGQNVDLCCACVCVRCDPWRCSRARGAFEWMFAVQSVEKICVRAVSLRAWWNNGLVWCFCVQVLGEMGVAVILCVSVSWSLVDVRAYVCRIFGVCHLCA